MPLRFYFDYISPYAYLAWTQIHRVAREAQTSVEPIPILFAALLNQFGHKGPAEIPPKRAYIFKNALRLAHGLAVPLTPPPAHPFNPLIALRVTSAIDDPARRRIAIEALFKATWGGGGGVHGADAVRRALEGTGLAIEELLERGQSPEGKERVRSQTQIAIERGVFGVPTIEAGRELFWGVDSLPHVTAYLQGRDPIPDGFVEQWLDLPAAADRLKRRE